MVRNSNNPLLEIRSLDEIVREADPRSRPNYDNWLEIERRVIDLGLGNSLEDYYFIRYHNSNCSANDIDRELDLSIGTSRKILRKMGFPMKTLSQAKKGRPLTKIAIENSSRTNSLLSYEEKTALVELIQEEIDQHKQGKVKILTTNYDLDEFVGAKSNYVTNKIIPLLKKEDRTYRRREIMKQEVGINQKEIEEFKNLVLEELKYFESGKIARLSTHEELAELTGWSRNSVIKYLSQLDNISLGKRSIVCNKIKSTQTRPEDRKAIIDLIKEELELYDLGKIKKLTSNGEFADILGISNACMSYHIVRGLSKNEIKKRKGAITSYHAKKRLENLSEEELFEFRSSAGKRNIELNGNPAKNLTYEQRRKIGREVFERNGAPWHKLDKEERSKTAIKSMNTKLKKYGTYFPGISEERLIKMRIDNGRRMGKINGRKVIDSLRKNAYFIENRFHSSSQQEGAVALLLEKYVEGYNVHEGVNFQVRDRGIDNGGIDFLVQNIFFEWHPIILSGNQKKRGDIPKKDYQSYLRICNNLDCTRKKEYNDQFKRVLAVNYRHQRQIDVDNSEYTGMNVALATNVNELYQFLSTYSTNLPEFREFNREFNSLTRYVKGFKVQPKEKDKLKEALAV